MNCNYLKPDVQVILFYLKNSIGNDLYEVGVYLLIAAFSMPFAISFTILLIVITNEEVEKNKEELIKDEKSKQNKSKDMKKSAVRIDNISEREIINDGEQGSMVASCMFVPQRGRQACRQQPISGKHPIISIASRKGYISISDFVEKQSTIKFF